MTTVPQRPARSSSSHPVENGSSSAPFLVRPGTGSGSKLVLAFDSAGNLYAADR